MAMPRKKVVLMSVLTLSTLAIVLAVWALPGKGHKEDMEILLSQPGCAAVNQLGAEVLTNANCLVKASSSLGPYFTLSNGIRVSEKLVLAWRPVMQFDQQRER